MIPIFAQADMGTVETATRLFGPMGAVCVVLCSALIYVFKLYHAETRARIEDVKARLVEAREAAKLIEEALPHLAKLARRTARYEDSVPPPSRARPPHSREDL